MTDEQTTRVPETVEQLVDALDAVLDPQVSVLDGPPTDDDLESTLLVVGYPGEDLGAITVDVEREQGFGHRYNETATINCLASVVDGDRNMAAARRACKELVDQVEAILKARADHGLVADMAALGPRMRWLQAQGDHGAACEVEFAVVVRNLL